MRLENRRGVFRSLRSGPARLGSTLDRLRARLRTESHAGKPYHEVPVFFVVGLAKSGTTWLMKTLDAHPEVLCKGEGRFFGEEYRREVLAQTQTKQQPSSLYNALLGSEYLRLWIERSVWTRGGETDEQIRDLVRLATYYFLSAELAKSGKKIVGDKTPLLGPRFVEEIHEIYPEARVIHIIRDGRDQAVSFIHQQGNRAKRGRTHRLSPEELARSEAYRRSPRKLVEVSEGMFAEKTLRKAAQNWDLRVGRAVEDGPALFGDRYTEVRYEDLLERPNEEVERLLGFLGVDTEETLVERCVSSASFEKLSKGRERGQEDPSSFYRKGVAGDWKNHFTEEDRRVFKEEAGELLIRLGYENDGGW
jgi:LPS sulfotransferase NodH